MTTEEELRFSWREWFLDGIRQVTYACIGLGVILGVLGLEYCSGIAIKFDFQKNSPEVGYILAGVLGGIIVVRLGSRHRLRIEQELSATLAEALPDEA